MLGYTLFGEEEIKEQEPEEKSKRVKKEKPTLVENKKEEVKEKISDKQITFCDHCKKQIVQKYETLRFGTLCTTCYLDVI
jgi:hypothetical protein